MMNTLELTDKMELLKQRANEIINRAEVEQRKLNSGEEAEFETLTAEIDKITAEIENRNQTNINTNKTTMETKKFSLLKAINDVANNRSLDEAALEVVNAGIAEMRKSGQSYSGQIILPMETRADVQATVAGNGQEVVAEDKMGILEPLRASLVLANAGATYMSGLVGNVSIPAYSGSNVNWAGETATATDGAGTFSEITLEPKRLTAYLDISKQFLIQDSASAEEMLKRDIVNAISNKLEATVLGAEAGTSTMPEGLLYNVTADSAAPTFADFVNMEAVLEGANVRGDIKFIVSPSAKAVLKTTLKDAKNTVSGYIQNQNEINGYPVISSSAVASKGIVFGNFSDLVIAQWGGIDLTIDPYTQAANGKIRLVINAYFDAKVRRPEAIVKKVLA